MVIIKFDHFLVYGLLPGGGRQKSETAGEPHLQILGRRQQQAGEQPKVAEPDEQEPFQRIWSLKIKYDVEYHKCLNNLSCVL